MDCFLEVPGKLGRSGPLASSVLQGRFHGLLNRITQSRRTGAYAWISLIDLQRLADQLGFGYCCLLFIYFLSTSLDFTEAMLPIDTQTIPAWRFLGWLAPLVQLPF